MTRATKPTPDQSGPRRPDPTPDDVLQFASLVTERSRRKRALLKRSLRCKGGVL